jgi:UDPglucose 6-dehydrogenase
VQAFRVVADQCNYDFQLLDEVIRINADQRQRFIKKVRNAVWTLRGKQLGVLGLAFKSDTDDIRESPAIMIVETLLKEGAFVRAYDPAGMPNAKRVLKSAALTYAADAYDAATGCDALLILTEWKEFANLDLQKLRGRVNHAIVVDGRNLYDPEKMTSAGFIYHSVGRDTAVSKEVRLAPPVPRVGLSEIAQLAKTPFGVGAAAVGGETAL